VLDGTLSEKQRLDIRRESDRQLAVNTQELVERFGDAATILGANGSKYFSAETMGYGNALRNQKTQKQIAEENEAALKRQRQQGVGDAKALAQAEQNIRDFGLIIRNLTNTIIGPFLGPLVKFGETMTGLVAKFVGSKGFTKAVGDVADWFTNLFANLSKANTATDIIRIIGDAVVSAFSNIWSVLKPIWEDTIKPGMEKLWKDAKPAVVEMFNNFVEFIRPYFVKVFDFMVDSINEWLYNKLGKGFGEDPESRKKQRAAEYSYDEKYSSLKESFKNAKTLEEGNKILEQMKQAQEELKNRLRIITGAGMGSMDGKVDLGWRSQLPSTTDLIKNTSHGRSVGTIGATGLTSEPNDAILSVERGERVLTPGETSSYNNLESALQRLNNTTALLLLAMKETAENTKQNVRATNKLSGDLFA